MSLRKRHRHCSGSTSSNTSSCHGHRTEDMLQNTNGNPKDSTFSSAVWPQSSSSSCEEIEPQRSKNARSREFRKARVDGVKEEKVTGFTSRSFRKRRRQYNAGTQMPETDNRSDYTRGQNRESRRAGSPLACSYEPDARRPVAPPSSRINIEYKADIVAGLDSERGLWEQQMAIGSSSVRTASHRFSNRGHSIKRRSRDPNSPVLSCQRSERVPAVGSMSERPRLQNRNFSLENRCEYINPLRKGDSKYQVARYNRCKGNSRSQNNCSNIACLRSRQRESDSGKYRRSDTGRDPRRNFFGFDRAAMYRKRFDCFGSDSSDCCASKHSHRCHTFANREIYYRTNKYGYESFAESSQGSSAEGTSPTPVHSIPLSLTEKRLIVALDFCIPFLGAKEALTVLAGVSRAVRCSVLASGLWASLVEREGCMAAVIFNKQQLSERRSKGKVHIGWVPTALLLQQQMKKQHELQFLKDVPQEQTGIAPKQGVYNQSNRLLTAVAVRSVDLRLCNAEVDDGLPASLLRELALLQQLQQQHALLQAFQRQLRIRHNTHSSSRSNPRQQTIQQMCEVIAEEGEDESADELPIVHYIGAQQELHAAMADSEWGKCFRRWCVIHFLKGVLQALCFLHSQRVLHRNLKPDNILVALKGEPHPRVVASTSIQAINNIKAYISSNSEKLSLIGISPLEFFDTVAHKPTLKICDFTMGRMIEAKSSKLTPENPRDRERSYRESQRLAYRAPELLLLRLPLQEYGAEIDLWSVGVMLFELTCDSLPFSCNSELAYLLDVFKLLGTPTTKGEWEEIIGLNTPSRPHSQRIATGATLHNERPTTASNSGEQPLLGSPLPQPMEQDERRAHLDQQHQQELDHEAAEELATAAVMPMMWLGMLPLWPAPRWDVILKLLQREEKEEEMGWLRALDSAQQEGFQHIPRHDLVISDTNQKASKPETSDKVVADTDKSVAANEGNQSASLLKECTDLTEAENILLKFGRSLGSSSLELLRLLLTIKKTERLTAAEALLMLRKCEEQEIRRGRLQVAAKRADAKWLPHGSTSASIASKKAWNNNSSMQRLKSGSVLCCHRVEEVPCRCMRASNTKRCDTDGRESGAPRNEGERSSVRTEGYLSSSTSCRNISSACSLCNRCDRSAPIVFDEVVRKDCQPCFMRTSDQVSRERTRNRGKEVKCDLAHSKLSGDWEEITPVDGSWDRKREIAEQNHSDVRSAADELVGATAENRLFDSASEFSSISNTASDNVTGSRSNSSCTGESGSPSWRSHIPYIHQIRKVTCSCTTRRDLAVRQKKAWEGFVVRLGSLQQGKPRPLFRPQLLWKHRWQNVWDQTRNGVQSTDAQKAGRLAFLRRSATAMMGKMRFAKLLWIRAERAMEPYRQMAVDLLITLWHEFQLKSQTLHFAVVYLHLAFQGLLEDTAMHIGNHVLVSKQIRSNFRRKFYIDRNNGDKAFSTASSLGGPVSNQTSSRSQNSKNGLENQHPLELKPTKLGIKRPGYATSLATQNRRAVTNASSGHCVSKEYPSSHCEVCYSSECTCDGVNKSSADREAADPDLEIVRSSCDISGPNSLSERAAVKVTKENLGPCQPVSRSGHYQAKCEATSSRNRSHHFSPSLGATVERGQFNPQRIHRNQIKLYIRYFKLLSAHRLLARVPPRGVLRRLFALALAAMKIADVFHERSQEYYKTCNVLEYSESASAALAADAFAREYAQNRNKYQIMCRKRSHMWIRAFQKSLKVCSYSLEAKSSSAGSTVNDENDQSTTSRSPSLDFFLRKNNPFPSLHVEAFTHVSEGLFKGECMDVDGLGGGLGLPKQPLQKFRSASEPPSQKHSMESFGFRCNLSTGPLRDEALTYALSEGYESTTMPNVQSVDSAKRCRSADCSTQYGDRSSMVRGRYSQGEHLEDTSMSSVSDGIAQHQQPGNWTTVQKANFQHQIEQAYSSDESDISTSSPSEGSAPNDVAMSQVIDTCRESTISASEETVKEDVRFEMRIEISVDELLEAERSLLRELRYNLLQPTAFSILASLWSIARKSSKVITQKWRRGVKVQIQRHGDLCFHAHDPDKCGTRPCAKASFTKRGYTKTTLETVNHVSLDLQSRLSVEELLCPAAQDAYNACIFDRNDITLCKEYSELLLLLALYDVQLTKVHPLVLARIAQLEAINMWFPHVMFHESACHRCCMCWDRSEWFTDGVSQGTLTATPPPLVFLLGSLCLPPVCELLSVPAHSEPAQDLAHDIYAAVVRFQRLTTETKAQLLKRRSPVLVRPDGLEFEGSETHKEGAANVALLQRAEDTHRERLESFIKPDQCCSPCRCTCSQNQASCEQEQRNRQHGTASRVETATAFGMPVWVMQLLVREPRERQTLAILSESSCWWTACSHVITSKFDH